jgi:hypothetical protein
MRDDMAKMLVKTHRSGGHGDNHKAKRARDKAEDMENLPNKESIAPYRDRKEFGENFPPMVGFLRKNVGRPWSKVHSELCKSLKGGGTVIQHAKVHLKGFVEEKPQWRDGKPHSGTYWNGGTLSPLRAGDLYVDRSGLLKRVRREAKKPEAAKPVGFVRSGKHEYLKVKDIWFEIYCKDLPKPVVDTADVMDVVVGALTVRNFGFRIVKQEWAARKDEDKLWNYYSNMGGRPWGPRTRYAYKKRQLNSKEIKRLGLGAAQG